MRMFCHYKCFTSEGQRVSYPKTHMTDMRPGSPWILHVVDYVEQLMRDGKFAKVKGVTHGVGSVRRCESVRAPE